VRVYDLFSFQLGVGDQCSVQTAGRGDDAIQHHRGDACRDIKVARCRASSGRANESTCPSLDREFSNDCEYWPSNGNQMAMIRSEDRIAVRPSERVEAFRECEGWISGIEAVMLDSCEIAKVRGMAPSGDIAPEDRAGSTGARSRTAGEGSLKRHLIAG
jgi:hypothetical protein